MSGETNKTRVLFLCTGNSCRSQMAEGLLREFAADKFDVESAGTNPTLINPMAVRVMAEVAIDITGQHSKSVDQLRTPSFDYVITVCDRAREVCPVLPGQAIKLHWSFDDPAEETGPEERQLPVFRRVRNEITERVREFVGAFPGDEEIGRNAGAPQ